MDRLVRRESRRFPNGLVLSRKEGEGVVIDIPQGFSGRMEVFVAQVKGAAARVLFAAPQEVLIRRSELLPTTAPAA